MKKLIHIICFSFLAHCSHFAIGQSSIKITEKSGKPFKLKRTWIEEVYPNGDGYWSISSNGLNYYVASFDKNLNKVNGKFVYFDVEGKYLSLQKVVKFKGEVLFFVSYNNIKTKKSYLFYTVFDPESLIVEPTLVKVAETKSSDKLTTDATFDVKVSDDGNHLLILGIAPQKNNRKFRLLLLGYTMHPSKTTTFSMWVLNKNRKIVNYVKNHKITDGETSNKYAFQDFAINSDGIVYILGKNTKLDKKDSDANESYGRFKSKSRRKSKKKWANYDAPAYVLEQIFPNGDINQFSTESGILYTDMAVLIGPSGDPHLVALLGAEVADLVVTKGIIYSKLSVEDLSILSEIDANFTEEVLDQINNIREEQNALSDRGKKRQKKREAKLTHTQKESIEIAKSAALNMNTIVFAGLDEEEHPIIVLEEQYLTIVTTTSTDANGNTTTSTTYYYSYDDLLIAKVYDDEIVQQAYSKSFTSVNASLTNSIAVFLEDGEITIMAQDEVIRMDENLEELQSKKLASKTRGRGKRKETGRAVNVLIYKRIVGNKAVIGVKRSGFRMALVKIEVN